MKAIQSCGPLGRGLIFLVLLGRGLIFLVLAHSHRLQTESLAQMRTMHETIKADRGKVDEELARIHEHKEMMRIKLVPELFSNFKSLQKIQLK